jgi:hypothetical protein
MASFNFGFGAELTFGQSMATVIYAYLPAIFKGLIAILVVSIGAGENFTFQNPAASNLGPLVDPSSPFLHSIAASLDVFTIWVLVLMGIGFSCVGGFKRSRAMSVVFGWWALVVLVSAGFAALFS